MNMFLVGCGLYAGFVSLIHIVIGGKDVLRPTLDADFDEVAKQTIHVCWHLVSINLVLFSAALLWMGCTHIIHEGLIHFISAHLVLYSGAFVVIALHSHIKRALIQLPQWGLLLPLGVALLWL